MLLNSKSPSPFFDVGKLNKTCFTNPQEMLEAFAEALSLREDALKAIITKGLDGVNGKDGKDGIDGRDGRDGTNISSFTKAYPIASSSTYIDIEEEDLSSSILNIVTSERLAQYTDDEAVVHSAFTATDRFAVGPLVNYDDGEGLGTRVYFVFREGLLAVPDDNFSLVVTKIG